MIRRRTKIEFVKQAQVLFRLDENVNCDRLDDSVLSSEQDYDNGSGNSCSDTGTSGICTNL